MRFKDIPGRIFLDTSTVNFMLDYGAQIHEDTATPTDASEWVKRDIDALYNIFVTGQRAMWQLAISPHTYQEIARTQHAVRRHELDQWFNELWQYWRDVIEQDYDLPTFKGAENLRVQLLRSGLADVLPDVSDRALMCDAIVYRCELFCTRDWTTILKHRARLAGIPISIVTPAEWWERIQPYAGIWA